ncbi:MAG TPA: 16S rRNA (cytosine(967)-C(5))-methyltransferase RsmB [Gemmatimonadaceae bacterium]|nr:16S rRNA (cytosine(967)-C(5))-methyltransferase RsmB [Gemmatimonadaceae bacterium]
MTLAAAPAARGALITESRIAAAEILTSLRGGTLLDAAFERVTTALDPRDRRWVQELVYGLLRSRGWIDSILAPRITGGLARLDADLGDLLRLGAYQLLSMGSVPAYAAIAQTVELAKRRHGIGASKLVNAVLRRIDRERDLPAVATPDGAAAALDRNHDVTERLAVRTSHPRWLLERWIRAWGRDAAERLTAHNNSEAPIIVRPFGITAAELREMLHERDVAAVDAPLLTDALQLPPGVALTQLGAFQRGQLYVQDSGSGLVVQYAHIPRGDVAADLCAAPGGKTLALLQAGAKVIASDRSANRLQRLHANLTRMNAIDVDVREMDATAPTLEPVDAVLVDVPCTGTGTFRRHPDARWRLRVSDIALLPVLQRDILAAASSCVKPGGLLIYSTCSLEAEENDAVVNEFLADDDAFVLEPPPADTVPDAVLDAGMLRVLPQVHGVDGAFAARMRRIR